MWQEPAALPPPQPKRKTQIPTALDRQHQFPEPADSPLADLGHQRKQGPRIVPRGDGGWGGTKPCPHQCFHNDISALMLPWLHRSTGSVCMDRPTQAHNRKTSQLSTLPHPLQEFGWRWRFDLLVITFSVSSCVQPREINTSASEPGHAVDWHGR